MAHTHTHTRNSSLYCRNTHKHKNIRLSILVRTTTCHPTTDHQPFWCSKKQPYTFLRHLMATLVPTLNLEIHTDTHEEQPCVYCTNKHTHSSAHSMQIHTHFSLTCRGQSSETVTHFSISFLAFWLSRSILVMILTCGISRVTMALRAAMTPEMNCERGEAVLIQQ